MKLKELKDRIDFLISRRNNADKQVSIILQQFSVGGKANSIVEQIYEGTDFDSDKIFIITKNDLIIKDKNNAVEMKRDPVFPKRFVCGECGCYVDKSFNYCSSCGQKLKN